ncbi:MAG: tetraacyldisaccharide 4'-kinase [Acetobacteraceae bacterium]
MPWPPPFWSEKGGRLGNALFPRLLYPASTIATRLAARRVARPGFRAPVPVICCGNVTVGGAGKTTLVLDLAGLLSRAGIATHILSRGYGGRLSGPLRVMNEHGAAEVGDEALLLAAVAPTWIGGDRAASARAAVAAGAKVLLMDDGLQNATLEKSFSFIVIDGEVGFGNGRVLPAGPLREPITAAAARADAAVLIGGDTCGARALLPARLPVLTARLVPGPDAATLQGRRVLGFAGIGRPSKFFATPREAGAIVAGCRAFPDHHIFRRRELGDLFDEAGRLNAMPVTTAKDAARLSPTDRARVTVLAVSLAWDDPGALSGLLAPLVPGIR